MKIRQNTLIMQLCVAVTMSLIGVCVSACSVVDSSVIKAVSLKWFGQPFENNIYRASLKELHLEQRRYLGKLVMVTGEVESVGGLGTYFVLKQGARMLLVTQHDITTSRIRVQPGQTEVTVKVVGELVSQKKALPALVARYVMVSS